MLQFQSRKVKNPFAYFTQIIYYAFIRRIQKEKKQTHVKNKIIENTAYQAFETMSFDSSNYNITNNFAIDSLPSEDVYKPKKTVSGSNKRGLEKFMNEGDNE